MTRSNLLFTLLGGALVASYSLTGSAAVQTPPSTLPSFLKVGSCFLTNASATVGWQVLAIDQQWVLVQEPRAGVGPQEFYLPPGPKGESRRATERMPYALWRNLALEPQLLVLTDCPKG